FYKEQRIFSFNEERVSYGKIRISPVRKEGFYEENYNVTIPLNHENLDILSSNIINPPKGAKVIYWLLKDFVDIHEIVIGSKNDYIVDGRIEISKKLYDTIVSINYEEKTIKNVAVYNRIKPFLKNNFKIENLPDKNITRNYTLLLAELIAGDEITSADVVSLTNELDPGEDSRIVITQQIDKQTDWLLNILRKIIDEPMLSKTIAKELGNKYFHYAKNSIMGPEHLMEKILSDYGKNIIFGVPALLNTKKYVVSQFPKVQFDIILIDILSDIEIVELKRPDVEVLAFDTKRNKFYPSKNLAVAIGQSERYISTLYKDNDPNFSIEGISIKEFIESEVGGSIELSVTRPTALIVIGVIDRIVKKYNLLDEKTRNRISEDEYYKNAEQAYRELRHTHKNIKITTYSELIESAELRLKS
ncbi:MAG: DUF4263 domain-containing protein, partial [Tissierellia bacterium]|nr:DUF4263 domain-containing protein [Tissierellia bacterium]